MELPRVGMNPRPRGDGGGDDNCSYQNMDSMHCEIVDGKMKCSQQKTELRKCPGRKLEKKVEGKWVETDEDELSFGSIGGWNPDAFLGQLRDRISETRRDFGPSIFDENLAPGGKREHREEPPYSSFLDFPKFSTSPQKDCRRMKSSDADATFDQMRKNHANRFKKREAPSRSDARDRLSDVIEEI
mmetsp:Transcript_10927/g.15181  ORF Transcript_10927/g.15181 Transcript_10927/m.15181 type:complete len:186 (-) Transcript_10927:125-682(-)